MRIGRSFGSDVGRAKMTPRTVGTVGQVGFNPLFSLYATLPTLPTYINEIRIKWRVQEFTGGGVGRSEGRKPVAEARS